MENDLVYFNSQNKRGLTPLMEALNNHLLFPSRASKKILELLLERKSLIDPAIRDYDGKTIRTYLNKSNILLDGYHRQNRLVCKDQPTDTMGIINLYRYGEYYNQLIEIIWEMTKPKPREISNPQGKMLSGSSILKALQ